MALTVTPHLNFRGQARAALDFYKQVFGGEQMLVTYGDTGQASAPDEAGQIMWGQVSSGDGFRIMAFDVLAARRYDAGANAFFVALQGSSPDKIEARWKELADGATILRPLGRAPWSALYGMLTDRFGVTWVVGVEQGAA
jgi:PhnB protein